MAQVPRPGDGVEPCGGVAVVPHVLAHPYELTDCGGAAGPRREERRSTRRALLRLLARGRALEGRTVILAAHRLSVVRAADQILVLEEGRPTGLGTHAELVETHDWYRDAWQRQQAQDELEALP